MIDQILDQSGQAAHLHTMKQVSLYEAKTHLSALVEEAAAGEEIVIAKNGKARAMLMPIADSAKEPARRSRPPPRFGFWDHYGWKLPANFDDPNPEIEALFYGGPIFPDDQGP
jgi:prevent-host-death family protein